MPKFLIKRKHTDKYPERYATENGDLRNQILTYIYNSKDKKISFDEYRELCGKIKQERNLLHSPMWWYKRNPKYIKLVKNGSDKYLRLTRLGNNLVKIVLIK